jgi:aspartyl-tRNA(Asn)/glutamyl-tRNA(Gln) amidotransferase subunit A
MTDEICRLGIAAAASLIEQRKLSPVELVDAMLARVDSLNPKIDAFITLTASRARDEAKAAEKDIAAGRYRGPLHGIPIGIKDIFHTAGTPTTGNSRIFAEFVPRTDATAVRRLREAGAVIIGKLTTHELAWGGPSFDLPWPPARNPWSLAHFTGGSSSGSAAALAAGLVFGALGSDTGGSIRTPASLCGITGLKPTYGVVSRAGVMPNSFSFDHCGPMARSAEDCALMLQAIAGYDEADPASCDRPVPDYLSPLSRPIRNLRAGVIRNFWEEDARAGEELCGAMESALSVLRDLGVELEDVRLPPLQHFRDVKTAISAPETFAAYQPYLQKRASEFGFDFRARILGGCLMPAVDYVQAQRARRKLIASMQPIHNRFDILITAGAGPAPRLDEYRSTDFWRKPNIYNPFNVTGAPAASVCIGYSRSGLPLGMQIAGRPFDEETVLRVAHWYEQSTSWHGRWPSLAPDTAKPVIELATRCETVTDPGVRDFAHRCAQHAGLELDEQNYAQLYEAAPYALAMSGRLQKDHDLALEPASTLHIC